MTDLQPPAAVVSQISQMLGDQVTDEQVNLVLAAQNQIREGEPVGTAKRDPETGDVAVRVDVNGVHMWKVTSQDGTQRNDMRPTLPWPEL